MKKLSNLVSVIFLLALLTACLSRKPISASTSDTDKIATIVAATLSAIPSATYIPTATNTPFPTETFVPTSIPPEPLDRTDIQSVLKWVSFSITENQPDMIADLIGNRGAEFGGKYQTSVVFPEFNNSEIIVSELEKGLQNATPHCMGYITYLGALPDKANIYFSNIQFPWDNPVSGFTFFLEEEGWELVGIFTVPEQSWPNLYQSLWACP